jgi:hypothetical protein
MSCSVYTVSCNFVIHATCPLVLTTYKYNELQVSFATQKLNCKANCKTPLFYHSATYVHMLVDLNLVIVSLAI